MPSVFNLFSLFIYAQVSNAIPVRYTRLIDHEPALESLDDSGRSRMRRINLDIDWRYQNYMSTMAAGHLMAKIAGETVQRYPYCGTGINYQIY